MLDTKPQEQPPEVDFCARCHEHAMFVLDEDGKWRSECCDALPIPVDVEPDVF